MMSQCSIYSFLGCQCGLVSSSVLLVIFVVGKVSVVLNIQDWAIFN